MQILPLYFTSIYTEECPQEWKRSFFQLIQKIAMTDSKFYKYLAMKGKHIT